MSVNNEQIKKSSTLYIKAKEYKPSFANAIPNVTPPTFYSQVPYVDPNPYQYNYQQPIYNYAPYPPYGYVNYQQPYYNNPRPYRSPAMATDTKKTYNNSNFNNNNNTIANTENANSNDLKQVKKSKDNYITNNDTPLVVLGAQISRWANESGEINFFADVEVDSSESLIKNEY